MNGSTDASCGAELSIASDHPAFDGHFPGNPIAPGVVLLDCALREIARRESLAAAPLALQSAKFHSPARPGERLFLTYQRSDRHASGARENARFAFRISAESAGAAPDTTRRSVASGSFAAAPAGTPAPGHFEESD